MRPLRLSAALPFFLASCGGAAASDLARAVVDTLPGGIPRVSSDGPTAWTDSAGARLVEEARWSGEDGTAAELGQPRSLAIDGEGRVYVVDSKPSIIKVFAPDGALIRTVGREGEGPGEFRVGYIAVRGKHIVLQDPEVARTSVWDTSGTFLRSWRSSCCYWSDIQIDRQERIHVPSTAAGKAGEPSRGLAYVRWSLEGVAIDTAWVPPREPEKVWRISRKGSDGTISMAMVMPIPLRPNLVSALHPDGGFVFGWTGAYSLIRSPNGNDSLRVFGRAWTADPASEELRKEEVESQIKQVAQGYGEENARAALKLDDIPATLPAFFGVKVDESGRVWVRRHPVSVADSVRTTFDVFDSTGAFLGPVTLPVRIPEYGLQAWTRDGPVAIIEDADGRPTVVRFRLVIGRPERWSRRG